MFRGKARLDKRGIFSLVLYLGFHVGEGEHRNSLSFRSVSPQFSVASQVETYFRLEVTPTQSIPYAVCAAQAQVCDNFLLWLLVEVLPPELLVVVFISSSCCFCLPRRRGNCSKWDRVAADPLVPQCALSWR